MTARRTADWNAMIDVNLRGVLHGIDAALPVFEEQGRGHFVTIVSTAGIKIVPTMAVAATKNAVRTLLEGLRQESTDGTLKTTAISTGDTCAPSSATPSPTPPSAPRSTAECRNSHSTPMPWREPSSSRYDQPWEVEIGELSIRPTVQG